MTNINEEDNVDNSSEGEDFSDHEEAFQSTHGMKRSNSEDVKGPLNKKSKHKDASKRKNLSKPVTVEELNQLREIENLYNSNLFRIQIDELLSEVNVKAKHQRNFSNWFQKFENYINNLPEHKDILLSQIKNNTKQKQDQNFINSLIKDHLNFMKCDQDITLKFIKPESLNIFGLYKINSLIGPSLNVNVNVQMKKQCFHEKDYLNNRYFLKRYYYLKYISVELFKSDLIESVDYLFHLNNMLLPVLLITPKNLKKIQVTIFVTATENQFRHARFLPDQCNVKVNVFKDSFFDIPKNGLQLGNVLYNSTLLHDLTLNINNSYVESVVSEYKNVQDAIKLLLIWLKQRELNIGYGTFSDDLISYFMAFLLSKKKINQHMSSYQVIRNFWIFLGTTDLQKEPICLGEDVKFDKFHENYDVVFVDRSGCYNLMSFVNKDVYQKVRLEAQVAVKYLDNNKFNSFTALFMTKVPFILQYDIVLNFNDSKGFRHIYKFIDGDLKSKFIGFYKYLIVQKITQILKEGLVERIMNIVPHVNEITWKDATEFNSIMFGITLNPEKAYSVIERGPLPTEPQSKQFRDYWEDLAQFRRFPDGTACDAVYFETETIKDRRNIIKNIISFIAERKLKLHYNLQCDSLETFLKQNDFIPPYPIGTNEEPSLKIIATSDYLNRKLRNLKLPLEVTAVQGLSDVYSYTDVFPPISTNYRGGGKVTNIKGDNIMINEKSKLGMLPRYVKPIECVIQLSHHSKWPNDLEAIRHIKLGFYLRIAELLKTEHNIKSNVKFNFVDVFYDGLVFRYYLYVPKEVSYLKKDVTTSGLVAYKDTEESLDVEKKLNILPKIIGALKGIQMEHPCYGPSTCLIKRWLRSQLIDDYHISDVVIDLLNASLYLNSAPFVTPNLPQVSFIRFLKFMFETNWEIEPLVINFNNEITKEVLDEVENEFRKNRQNYPNLFIVMPYDDTKSLFTKAITKEMLNRVAVLSKEMYSIVCSCILENSVLHNEALFTPNLDGYDVIIHLKHLLNPRRNEEITFKASGEFHLEKYEANKCLHIPVVDFNPVEKYLNELREFYSEFALFFHDNYGGNKIAVLWKPSVWEHEGFKASRVDGKMLIDNKMVFNSDAVIEDFHILGKGIVKHIDKR